MDHDIHPHPAHVEPSTAGPARSRCSRKPVINWNWWRPATRSWCRSS